ncbi:MAG: ATP-binding protein [Fibromonadaceae bacterium]|jgi:predicted ATPase|nr:ATP-binding protein [Fibromonadaceae bacterium]
MFLEINGIGKIQDSIIHMNGITVIAGANGTGKSTYGKILYCMFNAFGNKKETIRNARLDNICRIIFNSTDCNPNVVNDLSKKIINEIENTSEEESVENNIRKIIIGALSEQSLLASEEDDTNINDLIKNVKRSIEISDNEIQKTIINRYIKGEFDEVINHVNKPQSTGYVMLNIQKKKTSITIENNECSKFSDEIGIRHNAIYIDTPFVMDEIRLKGFIPFFMNSSPPTKHRENLRYRLKKESSDKTIIDEVLTKQKITNILSNIHSVIKGEFKKDKGKLMFIENGLEKPIPIYNVSTGIKTFLVIKRLLELGEIKERDILILDEPEIHLHPEWQLQFAEILILLQKELDLTILLTTHSPYFLNALEIYGNKHNIKEEKMNFYLAKNNEDVSSIQDVKDNLDLIYKQLAMPFQKLEDIAYED